MSAEVSLARRLGWWARVVLAIAVLALGFQVPWIALVLVPVALLLVVTGTTWLVLLLVRPRPGEAAAPLRRKRLALGTASTVLVLVAMIAASASFRSCSARPTERVPWKQGFPVLPELVDPDLGWAPYGPPDIVGSRLQRVSRSRPHVLLMGDSIVYGKGVTEHEEVSRPLERLLPGYQVLNASVSGYSIDQYMLTLERLVPVLRPKLVVVGIFTGNDYQLTSREFVFGTRKPLFRPERGRLVRVDRAGDCIARFSGSLLFSLLWRDRDRAVDAMRSLCDPQSISRRELEAAIPLMFDRIDRVAQRNGARLLYVLLPSATELNVPDGPWHTMMSRHRDLWRLLGTRPRERLDFARDALGPESPDPRTFLGDQAHLTAFGHALLARTLAREIAARHLLAR